MKLHMICENIRKTDFYDFYALAYVYQDLKTSTGIDQAYKKEVEQALRETAGYVFNDHINQLVRLLSWRLIDCGPDSDPDAGPDWPILGAGNQSVCKAFGLHITKASLNGDYIRNTNKRWPFANDNINKLTLSQKAKFIEELVRNRTDTPETNELAARSGGAWEKLANNVIQLTKTNTNNLDALILAIDRIYGLTHHGGQILDHFDESGWLENALNTRTLTSPKNLLFHASPHIRELLTSASIGMPSHEAVSPLQELEVMLTRVDNHLKLFGYSYKNLDDTTFELKQKVRLAVKNQTRKQKEQEPIIVTDWGCNFYHNWGKTGRHDYTKDKEAISTLFGQVTAHNIKIYDMNRQEIAAIDMPKPVRSGENSMMSVANKLVRIPTFMQFGEDDPAWRPIKGDPNPPNYQFTSG